MTVVNDVPVVAVVAASVGSLLESLPALLALLLLAPSNVDLLKSSESGNKPSGRGHDAGTLCDFWRRNPPNPQN